LYRCSFFIIFPEAIFSAWLNDTNVTRTGNVLLQLLSVFRKRNEGDIIAFWHFFGLAKLRDPKFHIKYVDIPKFEEIKSEKPCSPAM